MLAAIVLTLLCGSAFAQRIVESGDLRIITDEQRGTAVHYLKDGKRPLSGEYRILRGQNEESVHFSKGVMQGEYRRFRNGSLREKGKYTVSIRFTTYFLEVFENIWDKIWRN